MSMQHLFNFMMAAGKRREYVTMALSKKIWAI
jgi:hypothetical protein